MREQRDAHHERAHHAVALHQPARERHRDAVGHGERGDDPRALVRADAERAGDRRQRHVGDRRVEHLHERAERQRERRQPARAGRQRDQRSIGGSARHAGPALSGRSSRRSRARSSPRPARRARARSAIVAATALVGSASTGPPWSCRSTCACIDSPTRSGCSASSCRVEHDPDGHALHDLDPVARRVLRRQQRERGARARREALDAAVIDDVVAVEVGLQLDRLADAHALQLHFLEVRVDPRVVELARCASSGVPAFTRCPSCTPLRATTPFTGAVICVRSSASAASRTRAISPQHLRVARCLDAAGLRQRDVQFLAR